MATEGHELWKNRLPWTEEMQSACGAWLSLINEALDIVNGEAVPVGKLRVALDDLGVATERFGKAVTEAVFDRRPNGTEA